MCVREKDHGRNYRYVVDLRVYNTRNGVRQCGTSVPVSDVLISRPPKKGRTLYIHWIDIKSTSEPYDVRNFRRIRTRINQCIILLRSLSKIAPLIFWGSRINGMRRLSLVKYL